MKEKQRNSSEKTVSNEKLIFQIIKHFWQFR